jgi:adenylate cyclase, class 2
MVNSSQEVEIKLAVRDLAGTRAKIEQAGLQLGHPRTFEANSVFDTPSRTMAQAGLLIRLRQFGNTISLTYKGLGARGKHKSREELEVQLSDFATLQLILERLGYEVSFRYEKYRTEFTDGEGIVTLDETPIGDFLELEGAPDWIDGMAGRLGFAERDYLTQSYGALYNRYCEERGTSPGYMIFPDTPSLP